jgi:glycosyltransferase involved in cell wall biosynthesis
MRVAHVIARFNQGGTATWLNNLIVGQRSMGDEVWLLAGQVDTSEKEDMRFLSLGGIRIPNLMRKISLLDDLKSFFQIRRQLKNLKIDIVNTHTAKAGMIGRLAAWSLGKNQPYIVHTYHGHVLYGYFGKLASLIFVLIERGLAKITDQIFVSGIRVRNELVESGIGRSDSYLVLRPGVEMPVVLDRRAVRAKIGIPEGALVVGWLGRLTQIKRPDRVIELAHHFSNVIFLVGGEGELREQLMQSKPHNLILNGWSNPSEIWAASDIALLTSDNEAQPISLIEAGMAGIPLVGENVGSVSEVIIDGENGFLTDNFETRKNALHKLLSSQELRNSFGSNAKAYCLIAFSEDQFISSHREAYSKLISSKN